MKYQFYRFYVLLLLAAALLIFSFNQWLTILDNDKHHYQVNIEYLLDSFQYSQLDYKTEGEPLLSPLGLPKFTIVEFSDLSISFELEQQLLSGKTISLLDTHQHSHYYRLTPDNKFALRLGPFAAEHIDNDDPPYIILLFYSSLAILILLIMRPLFSDLSRLQKHATLFAKKVERIPLQAKPSSSIYPLAHALSFMSSKIVDLLQLHKDVSRTISHEVRTPLTRMKFLLEIVSPNIDKADKSQLLDDIKEIESLIDNYLTFAKAENSYKQSDIKDHFVEVVFKSLANKYAIYQQQYDIRFINKVKKAKFDRTLILLAAHNLISNSIRYAESQIHIHFLEHKQGFELIVEDDGPGIDNKTDITQVFKRGEQESDTKSGFGLGLYIVQSVAFKHQGEFKIERSATLKGAQMSIRWPR